MVTSTITWHDSQKDEPKSNVPLLLIIENETSRWVQQGTWDFLFHCWEVYDDTMNCVEIEDGDSILFWAYVPDVSLLVTIKE